jgi:hypothetical protein
MLVQGQIRSRSSAQPFLGGVKWLLLAGLAGIAGFVAAAGVTAHFLSGPPPGSSPLLSGAALPVLSESYCGNEVCERGENPGNCPSDCGCNYNGTCEPGYERSGWCADCQEPSEETEEPSFSCGNGECEPGEGAWNCVVDCGHFCGDKVCGPPEVDTCPEDCPVSVTCGDGLCSAFENAESCPKDCEGVEQTPEVTETVEVTETPEVTVAPPPPPTVEPPPPTEEPTKEPTEEPTKEPTEEPTKELTEEPTEEPTEAPTEEITSELTEEPTREPTEEPTEAPEPEAEQALPGWVIPLLAVLIILGLIAFVAFIALSSRKEEEEK